MEAILLMAIKVATHILELDKSKAQNPDDVRKALIELINRLPEHQLNNFHVAQVMVVH
jgi:hypothetical protein